MQSTSRRAAFRQVLVWGGGQPSSQISVAIAQDPDPRYMLLLEAVIRPLSAERLPGWILDIRTVSSVEYRRATHRFRQ